MDLRTITGLALATIATTPVNADEPIKLSSLLEPFVDDYLVDKLHGARIRMHKPIPREIVFTFDAPWEGNISGYYTVFKDGHTFRMYYRGEDYDLDKYPEYDAEYGGPGSSPSVTCYAESKDGIHWTRPNLGIVPYVNPVVGWNGSQENNIIIWKRPSAAFAPFKDTNPACQEDERYKAVGIERNNETATDNNGNPGGSKGWNWALYAYASRDGINWSRMSDKPLIIAALDAQNQAFWDPVRKRYVCFYREYRTNEDTIKRSNAGGFRDVKVAFSDDFLNWTEGQWQDYGHNGDLTTEFYTGNVVIYPDAPHIFLNNVMRYVQSRRSPIPGGRGTYTDQVLLTCRDGGEHWQYRPQAWIRPGLNTDRWRFHASNMPAWGMLETRAEGAFNPDIPESQATQATEWSFYSVEGYYVTHARLRRYTVRKQGLFSIGDDPVRDPRFRNVDLEPDDKRELLVGGVMLTKPFTFAGKELVINYATSAAGGIRVEIQDREGQPIPGFNLTDSQIIFGDHLERTVKWNDESNVSDLAGRPVRLEFLLNDADLYAIQFR